jgi:hypothetical protein
MTTDSLGVVQAAELKNRSRSVTSERSSTAGGTSACGASGGGGGCLSDQVARRVLMRPTIPIDQARSMASASDPSRGMGHERLLEVLSLWT